jgi:isocitrate dehydrogenase kinase/phosphatase
MKSKITHNDSLAKHTSKKLACDKTNKELDVVISAEVKEHFKKIIHKKEAPIDASKNSFFVKMSEKAKKNISDYEYMLSKACKNVQRKMCHNKCSHKHTKLTSL